MSDGPWKEVDSKKVRRQYINAISANRVEAVEVGLLYRLRRWPLANAFVLASLIVPPALFQYSQNAGANPAQQLTANKLEASELVPAAIRATCAAEDLIEDPVLKIGKKSSVVSALNVTATAALNPGQVLIEALDQDVVPAQTEDAQMLVVVYSTLSQAEAVSHANALADSSWIQEPAHPRVVQTGGGYYGVVFGQYQPRKAQRIKQSAVRAGLAVDAYLMNEKRVERWIET